MRAVAIVALALMGAVLGACGAGHGSRSSKAATGAKTVAAETPTAGGPSHADLPQIEVKSDADMDADRYPGPAESEPANETELKGHPASAIDTRAIAAVVRHYYAAAAARDGMAACRLTYRTLAEAVPEDYGSLHITPGLHLNACAATMSKLFGQARRQIVAEAAQLTIRAVRVDRNWAGAQFDAAGLKGLRYIGLHRERGVWKIDELLASEGSFVAE